VSWFGGAPPRHVLEGRSLLPWLHGERPEVWREAAISEYDYSMQAVRRALGRKVDECRLFMVFDGRFKYVHAPGFRPMLWDVASDPNELRDLGADPAWEAECARLRDILLRWALRDHNRITMPDARIEAYGPARQLRGGILIGYWDEAELAQARREYGLDPG
jgi:arylsulfatase A-like enzyme